MSLLRRSLVVAGAATIAISGAAVMLPASADPPTPEPAKPTAAIALGDSFISGEGAVDYAPVPDINGTPQTFPGWYSSNRDAFFCHRSRNASIHQADLPGIDARFNLACSGGRPHDFTNPSINRPLGRHVPAQLDQLRDVAKTHDIDVVLVGLGSNTSHYTFGDAVSVCVARFIMDAWTHSMERWFVELAQDLSRNPMPVDEHPCNPGHLATNEQLRAGQQETIDALRQMVKTLKEVDADGQHRIVLQDYTNPLPLDLHPVFHRINGEEDTDNKFKEVGKHRYLAGCPAHRESLVTAHWFSETLGRVVRTSFGALTDEFPNEDLVYLNVQDAFDGARLCENADSPTNTLARPLRGMRRTCDPDDAGHPLGPCRPRGYFEEDMWHWNKGDLKSFSWTCRYFFHTCQESFHPDRAGHAVLGQCLGLAVASTEEMVDCNRSNRRGVSAATCYRGEEVERRRTVSRYGLDLSILPDTVWKCPRTSSRPRRDDSTRDTSTDRPGTDADRSGRDSGDRVRRPATRPRTDGDRTTREPTRRTR